MEGNTNFFNAKELEIIINLLKNTFPNFDKEAEIACEIDPRYFTTEQMQVLKNGGFNRLSFGVQDFNQEVQTAIHRYQPFTQVQKAIEIARDFNIPSINFDLIYGLPYQNLETFKQTLKSCISLNPERFAIFNYAHVPWLKKLCEKSMKLPYPIPKKS